MTGAQYVIIIRFLSLYILIADTSNQRLSDCLDESAAGARGSTVLVTMLGLEIVFMTYELFRLVTQFFA